MKRIKHEVSRSHEETRRWLAENEREGITRFWLGYWAGSTARNTPIHDLMPLPEPPAAIEGVSDD